jgi:hypothetical protein
MALRDLPGRGDSLVQFYQRGLSLPGQGKEEHYLWDAALGPAWLNLQAWVKNSAEGKFVFDKKRRTADGWISVTYPLAMVRIERTGRECKTTTGIVGGNVTGGFDLDETAHLLRPATVAEDEQYLLDAVTALALRCGWQKGGEPLYEWLSRELATDGAAAGSQDTERNARGGETE